MPWHIVETNGEFCVHKGHTGENGPVITCHATRDQAVNHLRALYAAEDRKMKAVSVAGEERTVLVADTPHLRASGLSGVDDLTDVGADGMLFQYDSDVFVPFGAAQIKVPLVLAFYDVDGKLLNTHRLFPGDQDALWPAKSFRYAVEYQVDRFVEGDLKL